MTLAKLVLTLPLATAPASFTAEMQTRPLSTGRLAAHWLSLVD